MTLNFIDNLVTIMECSVCYESYNHNTKVPKSLPCGHSYCMECLTGLYNNSLSSISCPTCRRKATFKNVEDIPINYALKNMIADDSSTQSSDDQIKCSLHQDKIAHMACLNCEVTLCDNCMIASFKSQDHATHSVKEVKELLAIRKRDKDSVSTAIRKARDEVEEEYRMKNKEIDDSVKNNIESIKRKSNDICNEVREWEKKMIEDINRKGNEIKNYISTQYNNVGKNLPTVESIQEEGLFDASPKKIPSEKFVRSMEELRASCWSLIVTANLQLSTTGDIRKKETVHVSKINLLFS